MCGIAGIVRQPGQVPPESALDALAEALHHRGPDDRGRHVDVAAGLGLVHTRLAILDLSRAGHQPMISGRGHVLVYNGEVYNFRALRRELEDLGHAFVSRCDAEVVLRAFDAWGLDALARFRGMFALGLWSRDDETLFLARDPLGMKPLYWTELPGGGLAFASEAAALLRVPGVSARVDRASLEQYLDLGYVYAREATSLRGVRKLPPGHVLAVRRGRAGEPRPFWRAPRPDPRDGRPLDERAAELHATLREVVSQHLVADVPVGLLLSGGLDSSLIAALAARESRVTTLTMAFEDSTVDERPQARRVAEFIGSEHVELRLAPGEVAAGLEEGVACVDDLFGDWGVVSTRLVYRRARAQGLKVVLVGEGSDELCGGYDVFACKPGPLALARLYRRYAGQRWGRGYGPFRRAFRAGLDEAGGDLFHAVRLFELRHQLPNHYVMKVDKASMAESVEARTPYLDPRVAELLLRTPRQALLAAGETKHLLRLVARRQRLLPEDIAARPKFGGSIAASWISASDEFRRFARALILERGWADALGLRRAMESFFDRGRTGYPLPSRLSHFGVLAWRLLLLSLWSRRVLGGDAREVLSR
jgi:asparagine synthase (glutamine-hydrolysing)